MRYNVFALKQQNTKQYKEMYTGTVTSTYMDKFVLPKVKLKIEFGIL